ncbi:replication-relaxation family protein [Priestia aryabhattai]|uniref:replication-relaxation family protein n=1 Tax=Priestia aryabhattai TaxID=412384 RepID=UPI003CC24EEE
MPSQKQKIRQYREQKILMTLDKMGVLSRSQLQKILQIEKVRTMNDILSSMGTYLNHTRLQENVYYLSKKGREFVGSNKVFKKTNQLEHRLMRNDMQIYYNYPSDWKNEPELTVTIEGKKHTFVADARFSMDGTIYFVEIDNKQTMVVNQKKIEFYSKLFPLIKDDTGNEPVLLFYTNTPIRKKKLLFHAQQRDITAGVFLKRDLD